MLNSITLHTKKAMIYIIHKNFTRIFKQDSP